jgi:hypothetical protein
MITHQYNLTTQAMYLANRQSQKFRRLIRNTAGVIFLGCPHSCSGEVDVWQNVSLICKKYSKGKLKHQITPEMASGLAEDSKTFEQAFDEKPVLSLYETRETREGGRFTPKTIVGSSGAAATQRTTTDFRVASLSTNNLPR